MGYQTRIIEVLHRAETGPIMEEEAFERELIAPTVKKLIKKYKIKFDESIIVNSDDERRLVEALTVAGYRATTISTTGGFLRQGNATIFVGTEDENVPQVLQLIRENCHTRSQFVNPMPPVMEPGEMYMPAPTEVQLGGATVFVLDVSQFERF